MMSTSSGLVASSLRWRKPIAPSRITLLDRLQAYGSSKSGSISLVRCSELMARAAWTLMKLVW